VSKKAAIKNVSELRRRLDDSESTPAARAPRPRKPTPDRGQKVTIYSKGAGGNIVKAEGYLKEASDHGVKYIPKRGKRERMVMTYYSPFIMVVSGWKRPDPDSLYDPATADTSGGVTTTRGRYRGTDPRWVEDFLMKIPGLKPIALYRGGKLQGPVRMASRMSDLRRATIRLAYENPDLRPELLPLLT
jgi:hypothetical protein